MIGEKTDGSNPLDKMLDEYCTVSRASRRGNKVPVARFAAGVSQSSPATQSAESRQGCVDYRRRSFECGRKSVRDGTNVLRFSGVQFQQRVLRHVVLFKFKAEVTPAQVQEVVDEFRKLAAKIER